MQLTVEFHGRLVRLFGSDRCDIELAADARVSDLMQRFCDEVSGFADIADALAVAVDDQIASRDAPLGDARRVSLLPPVSGGSAGVHLTNEAIRLDALLKETECPAAGALCVFVGTVRDLHEGRTVTAITYSAQQAIAEQRLAELEARLCDAHDLLACRIMHRLGYLELTDASVVIVTRARHRDAAFAAAREAIDELKQTVPIWKLEHFADGSSAYQDGVPLQDAAVR